MAKKLPPVLVLFCPTSSLLEGLADTYVNVSSSTCTCQIQWGQERGGDSSDIAQQTKLNQALKLHVACSRAFAGV